MNEKGGFASYRLAQEVRGDEKAQKYIAESLKQIITRLR